MIIIGEQNSFWNKLLWGHGIVQLFKVNFENLVNFTLGSKAETPFTHYIFPKSVCGTHAGAGVWYTCKCVSVVVCSTYVCKHFTLWGRWRPQDLSLPALNLKVRLQGLWPTKDTRHSWSPGDPICLHQEAWGHLPGGPQRGPSGVQGVCDVTKLLGCRRAGRLPLLILNTPDCEGPWETSWVQAGSLPAQGRGPILQPCMAW